MPMWFKYFFETHIHIRYIGFYLILFNKTISGIIPIVPHVPMWLYIFFETHRHIRYIDFFYFNLTYNIFSGIFPFVPYVPMWF